MRLTDFLPEDTPLVGSDSKRLIQRVIDADPLERFLFLITVVGGLFIAGWWLTGLVISGGQLQPRIDLFSIFTSSILTIGLLWVYLEFVSQSTEQTDLIKRQMRTQNELAEIQKTQTEIMEAEYIPDLVVRDLKIGDIDLTSSPISSDCNLDDVIELRISNRSEITARNLHLKTLIDYTRPSEWPFPVLDGYTTPLMQVDSDGWSPGEGDALQPNERGIRFHSCARLAFELDLGKEPVSINEGIIELMDRDVERVRIGLVLVSNDKRGEQQEIDLQGWDYDLQADDEGDIGLRQIAEGQPVVVGFIQDYHLWKGYHRMAP